MRTTIPMTIHVPKASLSYACARRAHRVFLSIFLCLCLRIFLRRFLITEPNPTPSACLIYRLRSGRESYRMPAAGFTSPSGGSRREAPDGAPTLLADVLHRRPRGASAAHPEVSREGGPSAPRGMGGEDLPGLDLPTLWRAWFSGSALSPGVRRPGRRLFLSCRAVRGDGAGELRRAGHGGCRPGRDGPAASVSIRHRGTEAKMAGARDPRRADSLTRDHRARRGVRRGRHHDRGPALRR